MMMNMTTMTAIIPTAAPALKIPPITEQLLSNNNKTNTDGIYNFFIIGFLSYNVKKTK